MMNYKAGGKKVVMPEQEKVVDPRAEKSYRGKSFIAKGEIGRAQV